MLRRFLALAVALLLVGCCCPRTCPRPCPCPCPCPPVPCDPGGGGGGGGSGDLNCATFDTDDCDPAMAGIQSRTWMLDQIEMRINADSGLTGLAKSILLNHIAKYRADRNCKGNFNDGPGDCAPIGASNCSCLRLALVDAGYSNWPACTLKLAQGH
jgi:hypothetical protein